MSKKIFDTSLLAFSKQGDFNMLTKQSFLTVEEKPSYFRTAKNRELQTINLWTLDEAFDFIDANPQMSQVDALEIFVKKMDGYACMAKTERSKMMFSAAKAYAEYLLDCFIFEFKNI